MVMEAFPCSDSLYTGCTRAQSEMIADGSSSFKADRSMTVSCFHYRLELRA